MNIIEYKQSRTRSGHVYEAYTPEKSLRLPPVCIFAGMGVRPHTKDENPTTSTSEQRRIGHYLGSVPYELAELLDTPVYVIYQAAVSGRPLEEGLYNDVTDNTQLLAAQQITGRASYYPLFHSWSSRIGLDFIIREHKNHPMLDGTISAPMTTAQDGLSYKTGKNAGKERSFLDFFTGGKGPTGFPSWLQVFEWVQRVGIVLPTYPLQWQHWHDGKEDTLPNPQWGVEPQIHYHSAQAFLPYNGLARVSEVQARYRKPLFVITAEDRVFSPEEQRKIAQKVGSETVEINVGHRWFTANAEKRKGVLEAIVGHYQTCISRAITEGRIAR